MEKKLEQLSLQELSLYKDSLLSAKLIYEDELQPFYGMATQFDKLTPEQMQLKNEYAEINNIYRSVVKAMCNKTIIEINEFINGKDSRKNNKKA